MTTQPADDAQVEHLAAVLADADSSHADDVTALDQLEDRQIEYLGHVDELPDPASDGLEMDRCP